MKVAGSANSKGFVVSLIAQYRNDMLLFITAPSGIKIYHPNSLVNVTTDNGFTFYGWTAYHVSGGRKCDCYNP